MISQLLQILLPRLQPRMAQARHRKYSAMLSHIRSVKAVLQDCHIVLAKCSQVGVAHTNSKDLIDADTQFWIMTDVDRKHAAIEKRVALV